jgi:MGT family glycosyltransferase
MEGDLTLFPDVPELAPTTALPPSARYVGPIVWNPSVGAPSWVDSLDATRTVYVSAGSTGTRRLFEIAVAALRESAYQVVLSTGELEAAGDLPANVYAARYLPGLAVMRRSAVCVCHAGNGTVYQALCCGVPLVAVPSHVDQQLQAQLCGRAGVGLTLPERRLTPEALRAGVDAVFSNQAFAARARSIRDAIARHDGPRAAADAIYEMARQKSRRAVPVGHPTIAVSAAG